MTTYITTDGDMIDAICAAHYDGNTSMLAAVLAANPHLADRPPVLAAGIVINLPAAQPAIIQTVRLWD